MTYFYIHGYGTALSSLFLKPKGENRGADFLHDELQAKNAYIFSWHEPHELSFIESLQLTKQLDIYHRYRERAHSPTILTKLHTELHKVRPKVLVCHSMGCELLLQYLSIHNLPKSSTHIVFLMADIAFDAAIPTNLNVPLINCYCPWDQSLQFSSLINKKQRAGVWGLKSNYTQLKNVFLPATKLWNFHTAAVRDGRTLKKIANFLSQHSFKALDN